MSEHIAEFTTGDVESMVAKLIAFADGLPAGEQAALRRALATLSEDADVQGNGVIDWGIDLATIMHHLIWGQPSSGPVVRDHRTPEPVIRDHRSQGGVSVRDHRISR